MAGLPREVLRPVLIWAALAAAIAVPLGIAAASPLLAWRQPVYVIGGFAGVAGLALLLVQPLLIARWLPGANGLRGRRLHRLAGACLAAAVAVHVGALWITSPPDVIDALLFASPTPFSAWGVIAMWAAFATAGLAAFRRRLRPRIWRLAHAGLAATITAGTVVHALLIDGTMGPVSKAVLCGLVLAASLRVLAGTVLAALRPRHRARI